MTRILLFLAAISFGILPLAAEPALIPRPAELCETAGTFSLKAGAFAYVPMDAQALYLDTLSKAAGFSVVLAPADASCAIQFLGTDSAPKDQAKPTGEGYIIRVLPKTVIVHSATPAGRFHALQTLAQLLEGADKTAKQLTLPCMTIADAPRFGWRGFMLDESRHFSGPEAVKRLIDTMAHYHLNRLHWHLTDSPGWRIEIKKYPKLTEIGSRGSETDRSPDAPLQFYTQEEIREIVAYAKARQITIVPEIDMPGHADAAVISYPEHDGGGFTRKTGNSWPHFTFNPARAETLAFLDDILAEVAGLFPDAGVIHFGGDEVHFGWKKWSDLPDVKALMKREGFTKLAEVETWFNRRMAKTINGLGFATGGWDEIATRDLPRDKTLVFWWRHDKPMVLRNALDAGYPVILCPRRPLYFDFVQDGAHKVGRRWGGFNPLGQVYAFPESLKTLRPGDTEKNLVRGIQACLWTETTVTQERRDFMAFPRLLALAEAAWTPAERKYFDSFQTRIKEHMPRLRERGLHPYDPFEKSPEVKRQGRDSLPQLLPFL
jgi:hexosaminidase